MTTSTLPPEPELWRAFVDRDAGYEGIFFAAVRTTGIFCRPTCPARKPLRENAEFFATAREALDAGYRPCRRCDPLERPGTIPTWLAPVLGAVAAEPGARWRDADIRAHGIDPARVRRWFQARFGMTFHEYHRARRLGRALGHLAHGDDIVQTAYRNGFESPSGFGDALRRLSGRSPGRARDADVVYIDRLATPLGVVMVGTTERALCLLEFADPDRVDEKLERAGRDLDATLVPGETDVSRQVADELRRYFARELTEFTVPVELRGTEFQRAAWQALRGIPYGRTVSYGEQASRMGRPRAVRAVARANGANRVAIIVPCHRVIGADGTLTGYGGGLWRKRRLLALEDGQSDLGLGPAELARP